MAKGGFRGGSYGGGRAMPKGAGGMNMDMIKKAQKMQQDMLKKQEELQAQEYTASSGGSMVTATVSGKHELLKLEINPEAVDPDDVEMLSDMIIAAVNEAMRTADSAMESGMASITGGMNFGF